MSSSEYFIDAKQLLLLLLFLRFHLYILPFYFFYLLSIFFIADSHSGLSPKISIVTSLFSTPALESAVVSPFLMLVGPGSNRKHVILWLVCLSSYAGCPEKKNFSLFFHLFCSIFSFFSPSTLFSHLT